MALDALLQGPYIHSRYNELYSLLMNQTANFGQNEEKKLTLYESKIAHLGEIRDQLRTAAANFLGVNESQLVDACKNETVDQNLKNKIRGAVSGGQWNKYTGIATQVLSDKKFYNDIIGKFTPHYTAEDFINAGISQAFVDKVFDVNSNDTQVTLNKAVTKVLQKKLDEKQNDKSFTADDIANVISEALGGDVEKEIVKEEIKDLKKGTWTSPTGRARQLVLEYIYQYKGDYFDNKKMFDNDSCEFVYETFCNYYSNYIGEEEYKDPECQNYLTQFYNNLKKIINKNITIGAFSNLLGVGGEEFFLAAMNIYSDESDIKADGNIISIGFAVGQKTNAEVYNLLYGKLGQWMQDNITSMKDARRGVKTVKEDDGTKRNIPYSLNKKDENGKEQYGSESHTDMVLVNERGEVARVQSKNSLTVLEKVIAGEFDTQNTPVGEIGKKANLDILKSKIRAVGWDNLGLVEQDWDTLVYAIANEAWFAAAGSVYEVPVLNKKGKQKVDKDGNPVTDLMSVRSGTKGITKTDYNKKKKESKNGKVKKEGKSDVNEGALSLIIADIMLSYMGVLVSNAGDSQLADVNQSNLFYLLDSKVLVPTSEIIQSLINQLEKKKAEVSKTQIHLWYPSNLSEEDAFKLYEDKRTAATENNEELDAKKRGTSPAILKVGRTKGEEIVGQVGLKSVNIDFDLKKLLTSSFNFSID